MSRISLPVLSCLITAPVVSGLVLAGGAKVTPIAKVITLLKDLETKLEAEGKVEAKQYDDYSCFCKEQADDKLYNIEKSNKIIKELTAEIEKLEAVISELNADIQSISQTISDLEGSIKSEKAARKVEHEAYVKQDKDLSGAITAMKSAIQALKDSKDQIAADPDAKVDFVQVKNLVGRAVSLAKAGQAPPDYQYSSKEIVATLENLKDTFVHNKAAADKAEIEARGADEKRILNLENQRDFAKKDLSEKEKELGARTEEKETAVEKKNEEVGDRDADQSFLDKVTKDCEEKAKLWDQRSTSRAAELAAIAEAKTALESGAAPNYKANKKLAEVQTGRRSLSFLQLDQSSQAGAQAAVRRVAEKLAVVGKALDSELLVAAAAKASLSDDHFVKVRSIIKDLIAKLKKDAAEEAEQKAFCDESMGKAASERDDVQGVIEGASAAKAKDETEIRILVKETAVLSQDIADDKKALMEAAILREREKKENEEDIKQATEGEAAVQSALDVLKDYYKPSFVQVSARYTPPNSDREGNTVGDLAPEVFDSDYHGDQAASKGILGLLEVVLSDFTRTKETVTGEEAMAAEDFTGFKSDTETAIKQKEKTKKSADDRMVVLKDDVVGLEGDIADASEQKENVEKELDTLREDCVKAEESYAERVEKRKQEIQALKDAIDTLDDWQN